ncbi:hypothetical protein CMU93_18005, partial [Elizabethkingia anophelis]|nr:hypothetical protein [Elizabethkingia anophelis]
ANPVNLTLNFTRLDTPSSIQTALPVWVNEDGNGALTGSFSANVSIGNDTRTINLPNTFNIKPEWKQNLNVKLTRCGAYTSSGVFQEFMCYNLGADTSADPFVPSAAIHGAKYQWGYKTSNPLVSDSRYYTQTDDQANSSPIAGWTISSQYLPDNSWSDTSKTANDPCPDGYRVPTQAQWRDIRASTFNTRERVGDWSNNSSTNYSSAVYLKNQLNIRTLMFPATGYRTSSTGGDLNARGVDGRYWFSTFEPSTTSTFATAYFMTVGQQLAGNISINRTDGNSVRCVKE